MSWRSTVPATKWLIKCNFIMQNLLPGQVSLGINDDWGLRLGQWQRVKSQKWSSGICYGVFRVESELTSLYQGSHRKLFLVAFSLCFSFLLWPILNYPGVACLYYLQEGGINSKENLSKLVGTSSHRKSKLILILSCEGKDGRNPSLREPC